MQKLKQLDLDELFYIEKRIQAAIQESKKTFTGTEEEFKEFIDRKIPELFNSLSTGIASEIFKYCTSGESDLKKQDESTKKKIKEKYKEGIKMLEAFLELNSKISSNTYSKYFKIFNKIEDHIKLDTLISIHVRACQISNEIRALVVNGYADGALARWRSLHELCVIFLLLYDGDYSLIEMYNDYETIERLKKAREYQTYCEVLGLDPLDDKDIEALETEKEYLVDLYGKDFTKGYGWTLNILPEGRRNFREIEKIVGRDPFRVYYAWSSENIHPGVSAQKRKLGLREEEQNCFLTNSHDYGFVDPVQLMAVTLSDMSLVFLDMEDSLLNKVYAIVLDIFKTELIKEFSNQEIEQSTNE